MSPSDHATGSDAAVPLDEGVTSSFTVHGTEGNDWIHYLGDSNSPPDSSWHEITYYYGLLPDSYLYGAGGDDVIFGGGGRDWMWGDEGNDRLVGNWSDELRGGTGDDTLEGTDCSMWGGEGADSFVGFGSGTTVRYDDADYGDLVISLTDPSRNTGAAAGDTYSGVRNMAGGAGNDRMSGDGENNGLYGSGGADTLNGLAGDDTLDGGSGGDVLNGGTGSDTVSYGGGFTPGVTIDLALGLASGGDAEGDTLISIENVSGTESTDIIRGNGAANRLDGGIGFYAPDELYGMAGDDTLTAGRGLADGGAGNDTITMKYSGSAYGGEGNDSLIARYGGADLYGGAGADHHVGGTARYDDANWGGLIISLADPALNTGAAAGDTYETVRSVTGGQGADTITGDAENNTLSGGIGSDTLDGGSGFDILIGGAGTDTADYSRHAGPVTVRLDAGSAWTGGAVEDSLNGIENVFGGSAGDELDGDEADNSLWGRDGDDRLFGRGGADTLTGGTGDDKLVGNEGDDLLLGGDGADRLNGGDGADTLRGGAGDDTYFNPVAGTDSVVEGVNGGIDTIRSSTSLSLADFSHVERLELTGSAGISGSGGTGHDFIAGNGGANLLTGGTGRDTLTGGAGDDTLVGGKGADTMAGGLGADIFRFAAADTGADTIKAFDVTVDRFDLSGGAFTAAVTAGASTRLMHAGGSIVVQGVSGLSLEDWNALIVTADASAVGATLSGVAADYAGGAW